jgi:hypothetical protein
VSASLPAVGLIEACDDPQLFGFPLWAKQREILEAIEAGPRLHVLALGRRSGKTTLSALLGVWDCLFRPELAAMVRPGEVRRSVAISTNIRQARLYLQAAVSIVERSPLLREFIALVTEDEVTFTNGTALSAIPCTSRGSRGFAYSSVLMDECAHFNSESSGVTSAERVLESLLPSTAQFADQARVILASTPYGQDNAFASLFQRARTGELEDAVAHHASTAEMNPTIPASFLEAEERRDPVSYRSEYLALFESSGQAFLEESAIRACVADWRETLPADGAGWVLAFDAAFARDPAAIAVVGRSLLDRSNLICGFVQRWVPSKPRGKVRRSRDEDSAAIESVIRDVAMVAARYKAKVIVDQHLPTLVVDEFARYGIHAIVRAWTAESQTQAAQAVRARIYTKRIELPDEPQLLIELARLRTKYRGGSAGIEIPKVGDSHCDIAVALMASVGELDQYGSGGDTTGWFTRQLERQRALGIEGISAGLRDAIF